MTIENPQVVDAIGTERGTGTVVLTICDHLEEDSQKHLQKLQDKINCYLDFVESGQILESYPAARGAKLRFDVLCKHEPTEGVRRLVLAAQDVLSELGIDIAVQKA